MADNKVLGGWRSIILKTPKMQRTLTEVAHRIGHVQIGGQPIEPTRPATYWRAPVVNTECTLHQLSPYIGKLKSSIAADLIRLFSKPGDLIADPFCGAGTIALEARLAGRRVFASDISPYAYALTDAKLRAPQHLEAAIEQIEELLKESELCAPPDLKTVPGWVRAYFHPRTLKEAITFAKVCRRHNHTLGLSCLLGILHHQRPGFLSYPSSHLVPYLRVNNFPASKYPELYQYRAVRSRLMQKLARAYKRVRHTPETATRVAAASLEHVTLPATLDAVITSPPYMNALDYGRDNRLRLWFLDPHAADRIDENTPGTVADFARLMTFLAKKVIRSLRGDGYCVLVVGDSVSRGAVGHTARAALDAFLSQAGAFQLVQIITDTIPDIRRARRDCRGVKAEYIIVLKRI